MSVKQTYEIRRSFRLYIKRGIKERLNGEQHIGVYPLLKDNTSCFIVADFDKVDWINDCKKFINACNEKETRYTAESTKISKSIDLEIFLLITFLISANPQHQRNFVTYKNLLATTSIQKITIFE